MNTVGDVGFVTDLPVLLISDDDEVRTYFGSVPVIVRGIKTDKLAIGKKLENCVMFVSGTESFRLESSKVNIYVLREVPDDLLLEHLNGSAGGSTATAGKSADGAQVDTKPTSAGSTQNSSPTSATDFRTWSDKTGKYKIEAKLVTKVDDKVILKRRDNGEIMTLAIDKLSTADQEFLKANAAGAKP